MLEELMHEAERLGLNASMYYLVRPKDRERALRLDIEKRRKEEKNENFKSQAERLNES